MFNLRNYLEGAVAQLNPFDGGKTFKSVRQSQERPAGGRIGGSPLSGGLPQRLGQRHEYLPYMQRMSQDNMRTNSMVDSGQLPESQREMYPQYSYSRDNYRTNDMVNRGYLPENQREVYPQMPQNPLLEQIQRQIRGY